jgi:hypothetical protein
MPSTSIESTRTSLRSGVHVVREYPEFRGLSVISGVLYTGFGDSVDDFEAARLVPGSTWTVPERTRHFLWAKDGEVVFQQLCLAQQAQRPERRIRGA